MNEHFSQHLHVSIFFLFKLSTLTSTFFFCIQFIGNSEQELDIAAFKLTTTYALITFTRPIDLYKCSISLDATTKFDTNKWEAINAQPDLKYYTIWRLEDSFALNSEGDSVFDLTFVDENEMAHNLQIAKSDGGLFGIKMPRFGYEFGVGVRDVLQEQLKLCQQLLEHEPESRCMSLRSNWWRNFSFKLICLENLNAKIVFFT